MPGPEPIDDCDLDVGANGGQNAPVLTSAVRLGGRTTVAGTLIGLPSTEYLIEVFANPTVAGDGRTFLGHLLVTTSPAEVLRRTKVKHLLGM